ncbi:hypothetical protein SUGI_0334970 [Cryptomeria japonica]|uniref:galactolipase DONGLE, chloroplastic-like n=1 Tax=Cryptomeria japonica TaxID=3369 RepID=UPI0024089DD0|nr:galactolipase DONGLE, chloroplastic-like [Cryptomeria japonica]GLJ18757.1 hypothetical protein SUGI_0334970 [Cryptomeria japonica]
MMLAHSSHRLSGAAKSSKACPTIANAFNNKCSKKRSESLRISAIATVAPPRLTNKQMVLQSPTPELAPFFPSTLYSDEILHFRALDNSPESSFSLASEKNQELCLAESWREIQGSNNWEGLLNPLNPALVSEIIRYGVFVRSCYEAIELQPGSKHYGSCKYNRNSILSDLGMEDCGYKVTKYIYATPDVNIPDLLKNKVEGEGSNWIGYVAVAEDEEEIKRLGRRDIVIALRGTATHMEWVSNFMDILTPARLNPLNCSEDVKVEMGFLGLYTSEDPTCKFNNGSAREQLLSEISRLVKKYKGEELSITITGHSMGSALATLCAYDIAELGINRPEYTSSSSFPITVYSFAGPRVGNAAFKERCEELGLKILRVVNVHDVVTKLPGVIFNENFKLWENVLDRIPWSYCHVGVELALDHNLYSDFFQPKTQHPCCIHDLATYLQLLECCHINQHNIDCEQLRQQLPRFSLPSVQLQPLVSKACNFFGKHMNLNHVASLWRGDKNSNLLEATRQ